MWVFGLGFRVSTFGLIVSPGSAVVVGLAVRRVILWKVTSSRFGPSGSGDASKMSFHFECP